METFEWNRTFKTYLSFIYKERNNLKTQIEEFYQSEAILSLMSFIL